MLWWLAQNTISAAILALVALIACRFWNLRPSIRHSLWLLVLLKLIAPPFVEWPWNPLEALGLVKPEQAVVTIELSQLQVINLVNLETSAHPDGLQRLPVTDNVPPLEVATSAPLPTFWERYAFLRPWILGIWLAGALGMLAVHFIRAARFRRLMRGWRPASGKLRRQIRKLSLQMKLNSPRCLVLPGLHSPFIWSLMRPWLLWPAPLQKRLSPEAHETVIVHELAHLRRRDHWVGWLQLIGECLFWWNPLFWFVRRQIRLQAELACDAWVTHLLPEARRAYAEALIEVTALISRAPAPVPALGMSSAARQDFERRLTMIMNERAPAKAPLIGLAAIGLFGLAILPGFSQELQGNRSNKDLVASVDVQSKETTEARIDSLISELDSIIERVNAASGDGQDQGEGNKATTNQELKLIEAIELAYSDALLLKEGDDNQSEKSREEKIKQIEKNLQELLREVQSLKGNTGAKISVVPDAKPGQPKIIRATVDGQKGGDVRAITIIADPKTGEISHSDLGQIILQLDATGQIKANASKEAGKPLTLHVHPEIRLVHPKENQATAVTQTVNGKEIKVELLQSKDGKSLTINGKAVAIPQGGEAREIILEGVPEGHVKPIILNLKGADGTGKPVILNLKERLDHKPADGKTGVGDKQIELRINMENKETGEKGDKKPAVIHSRDGQHIYKIITDSADGKPKVEFTQGEAKVMGKDGQPFKVIMQAPGAMKQQADEPAKKEGVKVWTTKPGDKTETFWYQVAPNKVITPDSGDVRVWTYVESDGKKTSSKSVFKLPKGKAEAVAAFLKENIKGAQIETKVDGGTLTVTASPEVLKAINTLISLMQGKASSSGAKNQKQEQRFEYRLAPDGAKQPEQKLEFRFTPDGKEQSFQNFKFQPNVNWTTTNAFFTPVETKAWSNWNTTSNFNWIVKPATKAEVEKGPAKP